MCGSMADIQSAAAEIRPGNKKELECGPLPKVMVALPNIGGAVCSTPQSLVDAHYYMPCAVRCQDAEAVESSWGAPNSRNDLSH